MKPNKESQWTWPDTPDLRKLMQAHEFEMAKTRKRVNRYFLYLGIVVAIFIALTTFGMVYYSIHK